MICLSMYLYLLVFFKNSGIFISRSDAPPASGLLALWNPAEEDVPKLLPAAAEAFP